MKRYTLSECYEVLQVDPKTFRGWLEKAGIVPQVSKADPRVKYLSEEQLRYLAQEHERSLERVRQGPEVIPPAAYKKLVDQVADLDRQGADLSRRLVTLHEEALQAGVDLQTQHKEALERLREGFALQMEEMQRVVDQEHRQYESLVALTTAHNTQVDQVRADLAGGREELRVVREQSEVAQARQAQAMEEMRQDLSRELRHATDELRQQVEALLEQRVREGYNALKKEVAADVATGKERMDQLAAHLEAVKIASLGWQQRADVQEQALADLRAQFQEEKQARQALAAQGTTPSTEKTTAPQPRNA
jgi:chromosome segregation ATPase